MPETGIGGISKATPSPTERLSHAPTQRHYDSRRIFVHVCDRGLQPSFRRYCNSGQCAFRIAIRHLIM